MQKTILTFIIIIFSFCISFAQLTQTIRGKIIDKESKFPLIGVNIMVPSTAENMIGSTSDLDGNFRLENVPIGRNNIQFSYIGYKEILKSDIIVNSAKEVILNIEMEESITEMEEIVITAQKSGEVINEMATVSARTFSVKETEKYAGSRGEPARMASNFAGVQGADDSRNDIIIRGNSPQAVLWRMDGFNIPNPNHFSIPGTGGGPVTILNNKFLANSDFFTGAFPAEYGNGTGGVFDLKMKNGNNEKHEFSAQLGFLGTELMAEGPISKKSGSSYLMTYRYSTLSLFKGLGINVGTDAIPKYQDGAIRLNFPGKNGSNLSVFAIGGKSNIDIVLSDAEKPDTTTFLYGSNDRDQYFGSQMGMAGITYTKPLNTNTYIKAGLAISNQRVIANHDQIFRHTDQNGLFVVDSLPNILGYTFNENKYSAYLLSNKKINKKLSVKYGINVDLYSLNYIDSVRHVRPQTDTLILTSRLDPWKRRWDNKDMPFLIQPYIHFKYKYSEKLLFTAGLTSLYYSINNKSLSPIEPRAGMKYSISDNSHFNVGLGFHSQTQPNYLYYFAKPPTNWEENNSNIGMGLNKSLHFVMGYDRFIGKKMMFKVETYVQNLSNIPVEEKQSSNFSIINSGSGFSRLFPNKLANKGKGFNYGLEFTLEKFFSQGYYYLLTASVYDSKYTGSNGEWRNTSYNGNYVANVLFAKEFVFNKRNSLNVGGKFTYAGGRRYGDVDRTASAQELEVIYAENNNYNAYQFKDYLRVDLKINYKINRKKLTHEFALDLVNVLNIKNILTLTYAPDNPVDPVVEEYQLGFLPLFYYRVDF